MAAFFSWSSLITHIGLLAHGRTDSRGGSPPCEPRLEVAAAPCVAYSRALSRPRVPGGRVLRDLSCTACMRRRRSPGRRAGRPRQPPSGGRPGRRARHTSSSDSRRERERPAAAGASASTRTPFSLDVEGSLEESAWTSRAFRRISRHCSRSASCSSSRSGSWSRVGRSAASSSALTVGHSSLIGAA